MNIFAVSDTHLSFGEHIDKPMDVFGRQWAGYENRLKDNWKKVVTDDDLVLIPGDISWAMHLEEAMADLAWIDALPGKKLIVRGNHDLWWSSMKKMRGLFKSIDFLQNDSYVDIPRRYAVIGSRGWICPGDLDFTEEDKKIYDREFLRIRMSADDAKKKIEEQGLDVSDFLLIAMTHFPPTAPDKKPTVFTELFKDLGVSKACYGHLHTPKGFENGPKGLFDGVEYSLVSIDSLSMGLRIIASDLKPVENNIK